MISVAHGRRVNKGNIITFTGTETVPCPACGGELFVHGTCIRKLRKRYEDQTFQLRVMECSACGKTHRELPEEFVPYKRMDAELLCVIAEAPRSEQINVAEASTWSRVHVWVKWFLAYAGNILKAMLERYASFATIPSGETASRRLVYSVRLVVNSGNWIQHRSVQTGS